MKMTSTPRMMLSNWEDLWTMLFSQAAKMKSVREALLDLRTVVAATEENYRAILSHLGSEVEIAARYESYAGVNS